MKRVERILGSIILILVLILLIKNLGWWLKPHPPNVLPPRFQEKDKALQEVYRKPLLLPENIVRERDIKELKKAPIPSSKVESVIKVKIRGEAKGKVKEIVLYQDKEGIIYREKGSKIKVVQVHIKRSPWELKLKFTAGWVINYRQPYIGVLPLHYKEINFGVIASGLERKAIGIGAGYEINKVFLIGGWINILKGGGIMLTIGVVR